MSEKVHLHDFGYDLKYGHFSCHPVRKM